MSSVSEIIVEKKEIVGLYLFLKHHEQDLDKRLFPLLIRLEEYLFNRLSIQEMEDLPTLYNKNIDVLKERG